MLRICNTSGKNVHRNFPYQRKLAAFKDEETAQIGRIRIRKNPDSDPHQDPKFLIEKRKDGQIRWSLKTCILPWPGGKLAATQASYVTFFTI
jgi:hypothetical protein